MQHLLVHIWTQRRAVDGATTAAPLDRVLLMFHLQNKQRLLSK